MSASTATGTLRYCQEWAEQLARSGKYDGEDARALLPRIAMGLTLGVDPATAASNITVSKGKVTLSSSLQAALLIRRGEVTYEIIEASEDAVVLEWKPGPKWTRGEQKLGRSKFTIAEAKRAGLLKKDVWQAYPEDLLFARALTRGIKRFAPDLLAGVAACTSEEMGADVRPELPHVGAAAVATPPTTATPPPAKTAQPPAAPPAATAQPQSGKATVEQLTRIRQLKHDLAIPDGAWKGIVAKRGVESARDLSPDQADDLIAKLSHRLAAQSLEQGFSADEQERNRDRNGEMTIAVPLRKPATKEEKEAGPATGPRLFQ